MRPGLHFRGGSLTKSLVATVVLQLVAEGRLSLSDTLEQWLPAILPYGDRITIHQLLNHTSGVPDYWAAVEPALYGSRQGRLRAWTPQALVGLVAGQPPGLAARHGLVVLQHRLRPARPDRGGGHRQHARW
jgi:D-alanyl-D-alanine carboxypeptidase